VRDPPPGEQVRVVSDWSYLSAVATNLKNPCAGFTVSAIKAPLHAEAYKKTIRNGKLSNGFHEFAEILIAADLRLCRRRQDALMVAMDIEHSISCHFTA
jgi:hypothetical protein